MTKERLEKALSKAISHVIRQEYAGKHAQDRVDSKAWQVEYADVIAYLRDKNDANKRARKRPS